MFQENIDFMERICNEFDIWKNRVLFNGPNRLIVDNIFGCITPVSVPIFREGGKASDTQTWMRIRAVIYALTKALNLKPILTENLADKKIKGISLSDTSRCSFVLNQLYDHQNTFFNMEPFLDIMNPPSTMADLDFIISSDVFEHVPPPVEIAFKNCFNMLKNGGALILTVPYLSENHKTIEHFPNLFNWQIIEKDNNAEKKSYILENIKKDGVKEIFHDIKFHGGGGQTVEMRIFTLESILQIAEESGFSAEIADEDIPLFGIENGSKPIKSIHNSAPLILKKP